MQRSFSILRSPVLYYSRSVQCYKNPSFIYKRSKQTSSKESNDNYNEYGEKTGRGYEKEFFEKFSFLAGKKIEDTIELKKDIQELIDTQKLSGERKVEEYEAEAVKEEETPYFTIGLQKYLPGRFLDLEMIQEEYLVEGYPGRIGEFEFEWITKKETLCRESVGVVTKMLEKQRENGFLKSQNSHSIILNGASGTGKSISLCHIVLYARANDWLTLYIPNAFDLVSKYRIKPSETRKWIYDIHEAAVILLENFKNSNASKLEKIKMRGKLPKIESLKAFNDSKTKDTTLLDLIEFGITCDNPSEVFVAVRNELDSVTEYPVLIAIDDINTLYGNSGFMKPIHLKEEKVVMADCNEISIIRALQISANPPMINGTMIGAITTQKPVKLLKKQFTKPEWAKLLCEIPEYSWSEFTTRMDQYHESGDLIKEPTRLTAQYIYQVCSGKPKQVASYIATLI